MAEPAPIRSTIQKRDAQGRVRHGAEWLALWSDPASMKTRDELRAERDRAARSHAAVARVAAAARAVSEDPFLAVALDPGGPAAGRDLAALRGEADALALAARHHDAVLHAALAPADPGERRLLDLLEEVRCQALGVRRLPGIAPNLVAAHRARLARLDLDKAHLASLIPLAEALRMVARDTLTGAAEPSIDTAGFRMWDRWLRAHVGAELSALPSLAADQAAFGQAALALVRATFAALEGRADGPRRRSPTPSGGSDPEGRGEGADPIEARPDAAAELAPGEAIFPDEEPEARAPLRSSRAAPPPPYRIWTTEHDRVVRAADLGRAADLRAARRRVEEKRAEERRSLAHLVVQLQRRLMALQRRSWTFDLEEGLIDAARLDRVIVNPGFTDAYKAEAESRFRDAAVTLLIDNSGSMRGKPIELACLAADMVAAALERCGLPCEVLGFTTADWKGGQPAKEWARAGRPADPGRLNALRHVVYKAHDEPLRHARDALAVMLSDGLLKENVDGEALAWAARRLAGRPEARRVLIVLSDGAPVDQATLEANADPRLLDRHLRETIAGIERGGQVELAALGIRHDVDRYYARSARIDRPEELGRALVGLLDDLLVR